MLAAGMGSVYICADLLRGAAADDSGKPTRDDPNQPPASRPHCGRSSRKATKQRDGQQIGPQRTDMSKLLAAINGAHGWMDKNYEIDIGLKCYYTCTRWSATRAFRNRSRATSEEEPNGTTTAINSWLKSITRTAVGTAIAAPNATQHSPPCSCSARRKRVSARARRRDIAPRTRAAQGTCRGPRCGMAS